jgi:excisionase family DNA binding protein
MEGLTATGTEEKPEWLTPAEVCAIAKLPLPTIQQFAYSGVLPAFKPGTSAHMRFRRSDVDAMFKRVVPRPERRNKKQVVAKDVSEV